MQSFQITLEGITPLMMHRDNLEFKRIVEQWQRDPANRDKSIPGDDRSPAFAWIGSLYHDGTQLAIPTDCVMASCMGAGTEMKAARGKKSLKAQTQSGMAFTDPYMQFSVNGGSPVTLAAMTTLQEEDTNFDVHQQRAAEMGFVLDVRRARVGMSKHVRVRPVFNNWIAIGTLNVWDDVLSLDVLETLFYIAGDRYGILEWRPSSRRPGPFGRFRAKVKEVKGAARK
jgi:hypothetical protein